MALVYHTPIIGVLDQPAKLIYCDGMNNNRDGIIDTLEIRTTDAKGNLVFLGYFNDYSTAIKSKEYLTELIANLAGSHNYTFWIEGTNPRRRFDENDNYTLIEETIIPASYEPDRPPSGTSISTPLTPTWTNLTPQN